MVLEAMAEEKWTVVGRRRAARRRGPGAAFTPTLQAEMCDESLLLLRLKRSITRVQESAFFQRFLLQVQSASVCDLLSRAASTSCTQSVHHCQDDHPLEHNRRDEHPDGFAERLVRECAHNNQDVYVPMKSLTAENSVDCTRSSPLFASRVPGRECLQNESHASTKILIGTNVIDMECKGKSSICRNSSVSHPACNCSTFTLQKNTEGWRLDVVLYGLGSIADSEVSRAQFALILLLKERLSWVGIIEVYDPVLTHSECAVIKDMGCVPVGLDVKGRRPISRPTLFYMPHCEDWLYDNVLQANWAPYTLRQIVILGNSFQDYQERWSSPVARKLARPSYVLRYQQLAKEVPLEATSSSDLPGFNNLSWHFYELCCTL